MDTKDREVWIALGREAARGPKKLAAFLQELNECLESERRVEANPLDGTTIQSHDLHKQ
jgi:hypothetical protein